jgi:hypothetical protein
MLLNRYLGVLIFAALVGCGDEGPEMPMVNVVFQDLAALEATTEGTYEGWVIDASGTPFSTGKFALAPSGQYTFTSPIAEPMMFVLTVEPPGDADALPSDQKLLGGAFSGGTATLSALGFVTASGSADFATSPGTHVLLTPTTATGSDDDGGIWLLDPAGAPDPSVTLPPLTDGWVYEGWVVHQPGTAMQTAISYGKYEPQADGTVSTRDSDAAGPLSGAPGDLSAGPPFPGGDFVMDNGNAVPGGIALPFDFNGDDVVTGDSEWMHVISIEPAFDEGEASLAARPFQLKPFGNPFGDGGPTDPRTIAALLPMPSGTATIAN